MSLVFVAACCASCGMNAERNVVVGNYATDYGYGVEKLRLLPDGHYEQTFQLAGQSTKTTNAGKWELELQDEWLLYLYNPLVIADAFGRLRPNYENAVSNRTIMVVKQERGAVYLIYNLDLGSSFKKQQN